jgi:hypothetical protein
MLSSTAALENLKIYLTSFRHLFTPVNQNVMAIKKYHYVRHRTTAINFYQSAPFPQTGIFVPKKINTFTVTYTKTVNPHLFNSDDIHIIITHLAPPRRKEVASRVGKSTSPRISAV